MAQQQGNKGNALKDYVEVNVRIEKFWDKYPNGRIETEIIKWENSIIAMKAKVFKDATDPNPSAIGHAYEVEGSSFINKTSALENCETSVVGRALAILGFEIKKSIASKEEAENAIKQQQEPLATSEQIMVFQNKAQEYCTLKGQGTPEDIYKSFKVDFEKVTSKEITTHIKKLDAAIAKAIKEVVDEAK